jgi:hypothetical protein
MICKVHPVWRATINETPCMESETSIGYYTSDYDIRPSSCIWVKKKTCPYIKKAKIERQ